MTYRLSTAESTPSHSGGAGWLSTAYVLGIPVAGGLAVMRGDSLGVGGLNYTGFMWLAILLAGLALVVVEKGVHPWRRVHFAAGPWMLWLAFLWVSLLWTEGADYTQVRDVLQLCLPVLVGIAASLFVRTRADLERLIRAFYWLVPMLAVFVAVWYVFELDQEWRDDMYVEIRGLALTAVFVSGVFMAIAADRPMLGWLGWGACLLLTVFSGSRMASATMLLLPAFAPPFRGIGRRLLAVGAICVIGLIVFLTPTFQERFFTEGSGDLGRIASGDFDSKGRFDVWPIVMDEALKRPWFGHGACTVQRLIPDLWDEVVAPHNDYLRLLYEVGIVGLTLFVSLLLWQLWSLARQVSRTDGVVRQAAGAAWLGWIAFLPIAYTDNPIMYTLCYMNLMFVLGGAASSVECEEALATADTRSAQRREWPSLIPRAALPAHPAE